MGGDPLRREARLEQRLQTVVLGRVHADEHRLRELQRKAGRGHQHAAAFGGVGLPVAADRVHVLRGRHRPEPRLLGKQFEALGPVDRALLPHLLERLVRRTVGPELFLRQFNVLDVAPNRRHFQTSEDRRRGMPPDATGWLARSEVDRLPETCQAMTTRRYDRYTQFEQRSDLTALNLARLLNWKRRTGVEPATSSLGSLRSTN